MKRREGREIEKLRIEGPGSSFVMGDMEVEAEAEGSPRPETVHPPRVKHCNCEVGLFKQLREMVARGEALARDFLADAAKDRICASLDVRFVAGQVTGMTVTDATGKAEAISLGDRIEVHAIRKGRGWGEFVREDLLKLAEALLFSGQVSVFMYQGRMSGSLYSETFSHVAASKQ